MPGNERGPLAGPGAHDTIERILTEAADARPTGPLPWARSSASRVMLGSLEDFLRIEPADPEALLIVSEARGALGHGRHAVFLLHMARVFERAAVRAQALERSLSRKGNVS